MPARIDQIRQIVTGLLALQGHAGESPFSLEVGDGEFVQASKWVADGYFVVVDIQNGHVVIQKQVEFHNCQDGEVLLQFGCAFENAIF